MTALTLYYHPLSSFCWKALIALYEGDIAFTPRMINPMDPGDRAAFRQVWPLAKFPVLRDEARNETVPESTVIFSWLARTQPSAAFLIPADPDRALRAYLLDRLFDNYIHLPMSQVVAERMRPEDKHDPFGAEQSRVAIRAGYEAVAPMIEGHWALGDSFTIADCAALPALFYADYATPLPPALKAYLERLKTRPSIARVLKEAEPFFQYFPLKDG